jgi:ABC-type branched-subunit amino acid transport system substrate-binding protein
LQRTGEWDITRTFGTDGLKTSSYVKDFGASLGDGMRGTAPGAGDPSVAAGVAAFDTLWKAEVGPDRQTFDAQTFDAAVIIGLAAIAGGSNEATVIRDNLPAVTGGGTPYSWEQLDEAVAALLAGEDINYDGVSGPIDFDEDGEISPTGVTYEIWQMGDGKITVIDTIDATTLV